MTRYIPHAIIAGLILGVTIALILTYSNSACAASAKPSKPATKTHKIHLDCD